MRPLATQATLVDQVYEQIVAEICDGRLKSNERLIQDELARSFGVSRQPIQQALLLLHRNGFVREALGRGLVVAPIDIRAVDELYEIRAVIEGLAARRAAGRKDEAAIKRALSLIENGRRAVEQHSLTKLIRADIEFHKTVYDMSGNEMIREAMLPNWYHFARVMGVVLQEEKPRDIWDQHHAILAAIIDQKADEAEALAERHITQAAKEFVARLRRLELKETLGSV